MAYDSLESSVVVGRLLCGPYTALFGRVQDHGLPIAPDHDDVVADLDIVNLHPSVDDQPPGTALGVNHRYPDKARR